MSKGYSFGAGEFKLGDRVEIMTTQQRGILVSEMVHISGCNTYGVLLPKVKSEYSDRRAVRQYDYLILRKLEPNEAVFGDEDNLPEEMIFSPKSLDVNKEWIIESMEAGKEPITEVDDAVGVDEIDIQPGTEVWHKAYSQIMLVNYICREIYCKELEYGVFYMANDKEVSLSSHRYALIPMHTRLAIQNGSDSEKYGSIFSSKFTETDSEITFGNTFRHGAER